MNTNSAGGFNGPAQIPVFDFHTSKWPFPHANGLTCARSCCSMRRDCSTLPFKLTFKGDVCVLFWQPSDQTDKRTRRPTNTGTDTESPSASPFISHLSVYYEKPDSCQTIMTWYNPFLASWPGKTLIPLIVNNHNLSGKVLVCFTKRDIFTNRFV